MIKKFKKEVDIKIYNKNIKKTKLYSNTYIVNYHLISEKVVNMCPCDITSMFISIHDLTKMDKCKEYHNIIY